MIYLPFENTVTEEDPDLSEKLWNERDGIVTYLLKYALKLEELDYKFPHIPEDDTKVSVEKRPTDYLPGFINSCCERGADFFCPTSNMRKAYALWLDDDRSLVDEFSYVIEDLIQEDFEIAEANMKARMKIA